MINQILKKFITFLFALFLLFSAGTAGADSSLHTSRGTSLHHDKKIDSFRKIQFTNHFQGMFSFSGFNESKFGFGDSFNSFGGKFNDFFNKPIFVIDHPVVRGAPILFDSPPICCSPSASAVPPEFFFNSRLFIDDRSFFRQPIFFDAKDKRFFDNDHFFDSFDRGKSGF